MYTKDIIINELNRCPDLVKVFGEALDKYNKEAEDREKARVNRTKPLWSYELYSNDCKKYRGVIFATDNNEARQLLMRKYGYLCNNDDDISLEYVDCVDPCIEVSVSISL